MGLNVGSQNVSESDSENFEHELRRKKHMTWLVLNAADSSAYIT